MGRSRKGQKVSITDGLEFVTAPGPSDLLGINRSRNLFVAQLYPSKRDSSIVGTLLVNNFNCTLFGRTGSWSRLMNGL
jgi:hypothetical protein